MLHVWSAFVKLIVNWDLFPSLGASKILVYFKYQNKHHPFTYVPVCPF